MVARLPDGFRVDPADPRAPAHDLWLRMSLEERARVVEMLPSEFELDAMPPEGDPHSTPILVTRTTLGGFYRRVGRKVYISSNLAVFYPGERCIAPDVIAVCDVEPAPRQKWVVDLEGRGVDFALEVHVLGDREKDEVTNVERYARLGIAEYFYFDPVRHLLRGYRLPPEEPSSKRRIYQPIVPQGGRLASATLGLEMMIEGGRLRFYHGSAMVLEADEIVAKLDTALGEALAGREKAEREAQAEAERAQAETARAQAEAERAQAETARAQVEAERAQVEAERAAALEKENAELRAEIARLRRER